jgi:hypothetical protein
MISKKIKEKGVLSIFLEKCIKIILIKECKKISNIKIDIIATSSQIIKGLIQKINIIAEDINYKDILFDAIKLEANNVKINFRVYNKELKFENNIIIKFKVSLSENSLNSVLLSKKWNWIANRISNEILNQKILEDIKIKNNYILMRTSTDKQGVSEEIKVEIKAEEGSLYLDNKLCNKSIRIPIEEKVCIKNLSIENDLINISANSSVEL